MGLMWKGSMYAVCQRACRRYPHQFCPRRRVQPDGAVSIPPMEAHDRWESKHHFPAVSEKPKENEHFFLEGLTPSIVGVRSSRF